METLPALLQVSNLTFTRQQKTVLAPLSFTLQAGAFLWLTGPSGSGKSTLLRLIASLQEPTGGEVRFHGQPITELKPEAYRQRVSFVCQTPQLFGTTVYDNLALPYQVRQQAVDRPQLADWLQRVSLPADLLDQPVAPLSGGERQRVALLRHLQFPPEILLLDEITSALDESNKQLIRALIHQQNTAGVAAIWISHDSQELNDGQRVLTLPLPEDAA